MIDLDAIKKRDAQSRSAVGIKEQIGFMAQAIEDRRALLELLDELEVAAKNAYVEFWLGKKHLDNSKEAK